MVGEPLQCGPVVAVDIGGTKIASAIVTDDRAIAEAVERIRAHLVSAGWEHRFSIASPIAGGDGNREVVAGFRRAQ